MSPGLFQYFMDVYKTLRLSALGIQHSVVVMSARLNPIGYQFLIPVSWNLCSESVGHNILRPSWELQHWLSEFNYRLDGILYLLVFQYWHCELCVENRWRRGRKHCFVNFCFLEVLESLMDEGWWGWGRKSLLGAAKIASFSRRNFSWSNKHDTFWRVVTTRYFYVLFLWTIAVSDFCLLDFFFLYNNIKIRRKKTINTTD